METLIATLLTRCHEYSRQFVRTTIPCFFRLIRIINRSENDHLSSEILNFLFVFETERKMEDK